MRRWFTPRRGTVLTELLGLWLRPLLRFLLCRRLAGMGLALRKG